MKLLVVACYFQLVNCYFALIGLRIYSYWFAPPQQSETSLVYKHLHLSVRISQYIYPLCLIVGLFSIWLILIDRTSKSNQLLLEAHASIIEIFSYITKKHTVQAGKHPCISWKAIYLNELSGIFLNNENLFRSVWQFPQDNFGCWRVCLWRCCRWGF